MGCSSSKAAGVAPDTKINHDHDDKRFKGARPKDAPSSPAEATAAGTLAIQSISLESCAATPREESGAAFFAQQPTAKQQQKQPDPEFDYDLQPNPAAAINPAASAALQPLGSTASASSRTAAQPSAPVGGLLCRQPDWLRLDGGDGGTHQPAGSVTSFSNTESGSMDSSSGSNRAALSLPPIGRGLAAFEPAGNKQSSRSSLDALPALLARDLVQQSITGPAGAAGAAAAIAMELPAPRRLTANISSRMVPGQQPARMNQSGCNDDGSVEAAAMVEATAADTKNACNATASLHQQSSMGGMNLQGNDLLMHNSSGGSSSATSLEPSMAGSNVDPSNPWSALQNHVGAAGAPSPETTMSGGTGDAGATAAAAAGRRKSGVVAQAAVSGAGAGAGCKHIVREASELVLEDSSDSDVEAGGSGSSSHRKAGLGASVDEQVAAVTAAVLAEQHKASSGTARLQGEGSVKNVHQRMQGPEQQQQQEEYEGGLTAERSTVRAGGWGKGSMAAAGTLMLGDDEQLVLSEAGGTYTSSTPAGALAHEDDVFGADSPRHSVGVPPSSRNARQGVAGGVVGEVTSSGAVGYHAAGAAAAVIQQEEELLGVEEVDDVDAIIEAELAAKNALPSDLAAKLAAFEAIADDDQ